jgi:hypothetical protein
MSKGNPQYRLNKHESDFVFLARQLKISFAALCGELRALRDGEFANENNPDGEGEYRKKEAINWKNVFKGKGK